MGLTRITSDGITDAAIVNADINGSAAIAGTKISPDFGSQNITTTGQIQIGGTLPILAFVDSDNNPDYEIKNANGNLNIRNTTTSSNAMQFLSDGHIDVNANTDFASGIDVTGNITTTGSITATTGTITSQDITIQDQQPRLNFVDNAGSPNDPDYLFQVDGGQFVLHDSTNGVNKFAVQADGHMDFVNN